MKNLAFSKKGEKETRNFGETKRFWPGKILSQDREDIRVLTYGYDSKVTKGFVAPSSKNGIFQHGNSLCRALSRVRNDCSDRPIIFVTHSLGGLVVKQALIEARKQTDDHSLHNVYSRAHATIFFGTPHRGSNLASWGLILSAIAQAVQIDANRAILRDLDPTSGSSKLEELRLDFDDILRDKGRTIELRVFSFQEEQGISGVKLLGGKVVPNESSSLDSRRYGNDTIPANHMDMGRFSDNNDEGYDKFLNVLEKYIGEIKLDHQIAVESSVVKRGERSESQSPSEYRFKHLTANLSSGTDCDCI